ncbi:MAG: N-acyl homoserine lactonase family protein [Xanthobacteraceae bacterium]|nr:N-acyl homoserine lactonase family protein [Xanthobacteraceae bacterium]
MVKVLAAAAVAVVALGGAGVAQSPAAAPRLYILNCGEGTAGDVSRWSPGVNEGQSMVFVDSCYLIRHGKDWLLWDTGVSDAVAAMPDGLAPPDPRMVTWHLPRTLASQLQDLGLSPADITAVAVSHTHPDHIGNVELFPKAMLYVQKAEYDWPGANGAPRFMPEHPVTRLEGNFDVFGDGSVVIVATPGHTPGHQSLMVRLATTGVVVLTGDAVHFKSNWDNRRVPAMNVDKDQTLASMETLSGLLTKEKAQLWINHDAAQRATLKLSPAFYQ